MDAGTHALLCSNANLTLLLNSNPVSADESENDRVRQSFAQLKSRGLLTATAQHTIQCASTHVCAALLRKRRGPLLLDGRRLWRDRVIGGGEIQGIVIRGTVRVIPSHGPPRSLPHLHMRSDDWVQRGFPLYFFLLPSPHWHPDPTLAPHRYNVSVSTGDPALFFVTMVPWSRAGTARGKGRRQRGFEAMFFPPFKNDTRLILDPHFEPTDQTFGVTHRGGLKPATISTPKVHTG